MWQNLKTSASRPPERELSITDISVMNVKGNPKENGHYTWGIVKVDTDSGHYGIGETFRGRKPPEIVPLLAETILGENPLDPPRITEKLARDQYTATGGIGKAAIAAIETACWDIKGKVLDVPVYELLGGKYRDEISLYSDSEALAGEENVIDFSTEYTPEAYASAAKNVVDEGFDVLKFDLDVPTPGNSPEDRTARRLTNSGIDHKVSLVEAVREEIGYEIDLGMDLHWSYTVETATRLGQALEEFELAFLEDPVHPEKIDAQSRVKQNVDIPILTGENVTSPSGFNELLRNDVVDVAAPDVAMCGGLSDLQEIASLCEVYGVPLAPHNLGSPVATVAGAHLAASIENFYSLEFRGGDAPWWSDIVTRTCGSDPILEGGTIDVPEGPGLGIDITDEIDEHLADGSSNVFVP